MPKYWALGAALLASFGSSSVWAQTVPDEYNKLIAHHSELGTLTDGFAGERIDLSTGGLEIIQTDIDLPGNNALPVRVGRRFVPNDVYADGHFGPWTLDIPSMHGTFDDIIGNGWQVESVGGYTSNRCTSHGMPPDGFMYPSPTGAIYAADDYWHGTFFYLPGSGDQELLQFWTAGHSPSDGHAYHAMTNAGAVARCVALASTSVPSVDGEGFEMVTREGVVYTLNHMVRRHRGALRKGPGAGLPRADYFLYPTQVADRFGNTVTYTWSATDPWQLLSIVASDGRRLDFTYAAPVSGEITQITQIADGNGHIWHYAPNLVTLPDGKTWTYQLGDLVAMASSQGTAYCPGINLLNQRTTYDDGSASTHYSGTITGPSGATVTLTMARIALGRSHVTYNCVTDVPDADPSTARPDDPYLFYTGAVVGKTITGPGLPTGGLHWGYSYGPTNNCWDGIDGFPNQAQAESLYGLSCTNHPATGRQVLVTDPTSAVTRYTFGNQANVDEGMLFKTEYGWNGSTAQKTVTVDYGAAGVAPYGTYDGWSPRGRGDPALNSRTHPQRKVTTNQQGRDFIWEVATGCSGMPYCFDAYGRPTKVIKHSQPEGTP